MYTIGEFAAAGRVSVRMLRHYDSIGLLTPASVDERTGYRRYGNDQLRRLLRIVELRRFGCGLDEVAQVLDASDEAAALRGALERRRQELTASVAADTALLHVLSERLHRLEGTTMTEMSYRRIDPVTVYAARGIAPGGGPENVTPVIDVVLPALESALTAAGRELVEPGVFWYEASETSEDLTVFVSYTAESEPVAGDGYEVITLPAIDDAAVLTHHGEMARIGDSWMTLLDAVAAEGYQVVGPCREVYLQAEGPQSEWVTELQVPIAR